MSAELKDIFDDQLEFKKSFGSLKEVKYIPAPKPEAEVNQAQVNSYGQEYLAQLTLQASKLGIDIAYLERTSKFQGVDPLSTTPDHVNKQREKDQEDVQKMMRVAANVMVVATSVVATGENVDNNSNLLKMIGGSVIALNG